MTTFSYEEFAVYPRRDEVLCLLLTYLNVDQTFEFRTYCPEVLERPEVIKQLEWKAMFMGGRLRGLEYALSPDNHTPTFAELVYAYDRLHATVRSYHHKNRHPNEIFRTAASEGNLPAVIWAWDKYPKSVRVPAISEIALQFAVEQGQEDVVRFLVESGCRCNDRALGQSHLMSLNPNIFQLTLQAGAADTATPMTQEKWNVMLESAVREGANAVFLQRLLEQGATLQPSSFSDAAAAGNLETLVFVWDHFDPIMWNHLPDPGPSDYIEALTNAMYASAPHLVKYIVGRQPLSVESYSEVLEAALDIADLEIVQLMLKLGGRATSQRRERNKSSWMNVAAKYGELELVQLLVSNTQLTDASIDSETLGHAGASGNLNLVLWLLGQYSLIFTIADYERALLMTIDSSMYGAYAIVEIMLDRGARNYQEALVKAASKQDDQIAMLLLRRAREDNIIDTLRLDHIAIWTASSGKEKLLEELIGLGLRDDTYIEILRVGHAHLPIVKLVMEQRSDIDYYEAIVVREHGGQDNDLIRLLIDRYPQRVSNMLSYVLMRESDHVIELVADLLRAGAVVTIEHLSVTHIPELAKLLMRDLMSQGVHTLELLEALIPGKEGREHLYLALLELVPDKATTVQIIERLLKTELGLEETVAMLQEEYPKTLREVIERR